MTIVAAAASPTIVAHGWQVIILQFGAVAFAITTMLALPALLWRSRIGRPFRWVGRQLLGDPISSYVRETVGGIVEEHTEPLRAQLTPNGGSSLIDKVDAMIATQADVRANQTDQDGKLDELAEKVTAIRHDVIDVKGLDSFSMAIGTVPTLVGALKGLQAEIEALREKPPEESSET